MASRANRPVVVRLPSGAEVGIRDADTAKRVYPDATIVRYQGGAPYAVDLHDLTRDALNAEATRLGIEDAATLPNKAAVVAAIEDAQ